MEPIAYVLISVFGIPTITYVFWAGRKLGIIETKVKNIESDIIEIKETVNKIRNGE